MWPTMGRRLNQRSVTLVSPPAVEPVSLADAKAFLKVDSAQDDSLINTLIASARRSAEEYTKRAFITQTWRLTMDGFSDLTADARDMAPPGFVRSADGIELPRQPIQSVESIKTTDSANIQTTVAAAVYQFDRDGGRLFLNDGYDWPTDLRDMAAVEIVLKAGYGDTGTAVPEPIRQAILLHVLALYENRQCADIPDGATAMLDSFRAPEAFGVW